MPELSVSTKDKKLVGELIAFLKGQLDVLEVDGRFMLAIELNRLMKPELDELRRRAGTTTA